MKTLHYFVPDKIGAVSESRLPKIKYGVLNMAFPGSPMTDAQPHTVGNSTPTDIALTIEYNPDIVMMSLRGNVLPYATLLSYADLKKPPYLLWSLKDVQVTSYQLHHLPKGGSEPTMAVTLNFTKMEAFGDPSNFKPN